MVSKAVFLWIAVLCGLSIIEGVLPIEDDVKNPQDQIDANSCANMKSLRDDTSPLKSASLKALQDQIDDLKSTNRKMMNDQYDALNKIEKQVSDLQSKNSEKDDRIYQISKQVIDLQSKNSEKDDRIYQISKQVTDLQSKNCEKDDRIYQISKQITELQSKNCEKDDRIYQISKQVTDIQSKNSEKDDRIYQISKQVADLQSKMSCKEDRISDLESKLEAQERKCQEKMTENFITRHKDKFSHCFNQMNEQKTELTKCTNCKNNSLSEELEKKLAEVNETIADLKNGLKESQGQLESRLRGDLQKHVKTFENVTKGLEREVSVLQHLINGTVKPDPETTVNPVQAVTGGNITAFTAKLSRPYLLIPGKDVVFDVVVLNKGQGYNSTTGVFTAPRSGVYVFNLVVATRVKKEWIDLDIKVNRNTVARLTSKDEKREDQTTVTVVSQLQAGDKVKVIDIFTDKGRKNKLGALDLTVFSGYFIQPL